MGQLVVKNNGQTFVEIDLVEGNEYLIGRSTDCHIQLEPLKGISRHHLKLYFEGTSWNVELQSRIKPFIFNNENQESLILKPNDVFFLHPYEFCFIDKKNQLSPNSNEPKEKQKNELMPFEVTEIRSLSHFEASEDTDPGLSKIAAYLKIFYPQSSKNEVTKLEGNHWVIGRDETCTIRIDDPLISRQHLELHKTGTLFSVKDLGSANGTKVNGVQLSKDSSTPLASGDRISIMQIELEFEVRDLAFTKKIAALNPHLPDPFQAAQIILQHQNSQPQSMGFSPLLLESADHPKVELVQSKSVADKFLNTEFLKRNKIRILIGLLVPILLWGLLDEPPKEPVEVTTNLSSTSTAFEQLTPQQQNAIKDFFKLAQNLYTKGKYELCLAELKKIHEIVPNYENSQEIQTYCEQGSILLVKHREKQRQEGEKKRIERQIEAIVRNCETKYSPTSTLSEVQTCLLPAIDLDPGHPMVVSLTERAEEAERLREIEKQNSLQEQRRRQDAQAHFQRAMKGASQQDLLSAIADLEKYLARNYSLNRENQIAKKEVVRLKQKFADQVASVMKDCEDAHSNNKYKDTLISCNKVLKLDNDNPKAKQFIKAARAELNIELKSLYENSVLEESFGNVDGAKQLWTKILEADTPNSDYFDKARRKLKKYGIDAYRSTASEGDE